jgi:hypothetical protein
MVKYKNYVAGWLDSSIHDLLGALPPSSASMKYALVSCIDSNPDVRALLSKSPELKLLAQAPESLSLGRGLLVPAKLLLEVDSSKQLFFGFDEVWFFPRKPREEKPDSSWLVGPDRVDQKRLDELGKWMGNNSCSLALGDGEGLNFIVKAKGLVGYLLGHSIAQPEPAMTPFETADSA